MRRAGLAAGLVLAWAAAGLVLAWAGAAAAQEGGHPCDGAVTQLDLNACSHAAWREADAALNAAYGAAVAAARAYDAGGQGRAEATLRAAQRAWVAFRDADCEAEAATWEGGSGQPMIRSGCLETVTLRRTEDLLAYAEAGGG